MISRRNVKSLQFTRSTVISNKEEETTTEPKYIYSPANSSSMCDLLHVQKQLMRLTNKLQVHTKNPLVNRLRKMYGIICETYFVLFTQYMWINAIMSMKCTLIFYELGSYSLHHINIIIMSILFRKASMQKSLEYINNYQQTDYNQEDQASKNIYDYHSKLNVRLGKNVMVIGTLAVSSVWYILTIMITILEKDEDCPLTGGILYQVRYPFETKYNWLSIVFDLTMAYSAILMHICNRMTPVTLVIFQLSQIKILKHRVKNVDAYAKELSRLYGIDSEEALDIAINECIRRHQEVLSLMDLLRHATKEMMLIGFFGSSIEIAGFIIQIFTATSNYYFMRAFVLFPADILQILVFFWYANEIYVESADLSKVIYNEINWITYTKPLRMKLVIMMAISQRPLYFRANGVGEMTLEKFKRILQSCFSAVTFFQTMYSE